MPAAPDAPAPGGRTLHVHLFGEHPSDVELVEKPLWSTARGVIGGMAIKDASKRRYLTSLESLRRKVGTVALPSEVREELAGISEREWAAVNSLLSRRIPAETLMGLMLKSPDAQAQALRGLGIRIGTEPLKRIAGITRPEWEAILRAGDYGPHPDVFEAMDGLNREDQTELARTARTLGPGATFTDIARVTDAQWMLLCTVWSASSADWNHVRRMLSAVFSRHLESPDG